MRRKTALLMAAAMAASSLAGCGGGSTTATTAAATTAAATTAAATTAAATGETTAAATADHGIYEVTEPIEIEFWHCLEQQYTGALQIVEGFNNSQDLIKVNALYVGGYGDCNEKLVAANAAGVGIPAISVCNTPQVADYASSGMVEDLTPYAEAYNYDLTDFAEGMMEAANYEGKQCFLPFLVSTQVIYYNKTITDELGLTIPEKFDDLEEFLKAAYIPGEDGRFALAIPGWDQWYYETFYLNKGVKLVNDDRVSTDLGSEAAVEIAKKFNEWVDAGYVDWRNGADASSIMRQNFIDGKNVAISHTSSMYNTYVEKIGDKFELGMAWLPAGDTKNQEIGGSMLLIPSKNDQATKNAAWQFLMYLCSAECNMDIAEATGYMPTRKSVLYTEEGQKFLDMKPQFSCIFENLDLIKPRIKHTGWNQMVSVWKSYMNEIMNEDNDIDAMIAEMVEEIDEILADQ